MAILRLDIEDNELLELIGIQSNWPEHRLVWTLNRVLQVKLERIEDFIWEADTQNPSGTLFNTSSKSHFSVFQYASDSEDLILVANIGQGRHLYNKGRPFDFLLKIESSRISVDSCIETLSLQQGILASAMITCAYDELAAKPFSELEQ